MLIHKKVLTILITLIKTLTFTRLSTSKNMAESMMMLSAPIYHTLCTLTPLLTRLKAHIVSSK